MVRSRVLYQLAAFAAVILLLIAAPPAFAETISLRSGCTLNNAIRSAMTDSSVGGCKAGNDPRDIIYVPGTVEIVESPVTITENISIVGDRTTSTLDGQGKFNFFDVGAEATFHIQDLFMSNGYGTPESGQMRVNGGGELFFNTSHVVNCKGVREIIAESSARVDIDSLSSVCGKSKPSNPHPPVSTPHKPNGKNDNRSKKRTKSLDLQPKSKRSPPVYTCEHLTDDIIVRAVAGSRSGIQCQQIDANGVGIQSVIDAGLILAVDIWGYVDPGVEVCLRGTGSLVFLDAGTAPRTLSWMPSYGDPGWTCSTFHQAGSLVLVRSGPEPAAT